MRILQSIPAFSLVLVAALARPAAGADDAQRADEHFRKGKELLKAGSATSAREEYLAAFRLKESYDVAGNLGSLELTLGMPREAAEHLSFAIHHYASSGTTPEQLEKARQRLDEAARQVGKIQLAVNVEGAELLVDGAPVGRAPLGDDLYVQPGERTIEARLRGYAPAKQSITIEGAQSLEVTLTLALMASPAPPAPGRLPGSAGEPPPPDPRSTGRPLSPVLVTGGIAAAAAAIAGAVFVGISSSKASDASAELGTLRVARGNRACTGASAPPECASLQNTLGAKDTFANLALWSFVGAGALGLGTAAYALTSRGHATKTGLGAAPLVTANGGGVVIGGAW